MRRRPGSAAPTPARSGSAATSPRAAGPTARARRELAGYYAHIEATDRSIGKLLGSVPPGTIAVFTSVHGDMHGSHGLFRKGWPHEESVRVPLLVRGARRAGRHDAPVSLVDLPRMTMAWADGTADPVPAGGFSRISMPSVVRLADQCDRVWEGRKVAHPEARPQCRRLSLAPLRPGGRPP